MFKNAENGEGLGPYIITRCENIEKIQIIESLGGKVLQLKGTSRYITWEEILNRLEDEGIRSVMIEGGSNVILDCLTNKVCDTVIVTIAPCYLGGTVRADSKLKLQLEDVQWKQFGRDIVMAARHY